MVNTPTLFRLLNIFIFFIFTENIFSRAEKYDPMVAYKRVFVQRNGPKKEKIVIAQTNEVIASALYFYNDKNQLLEARYYLKDKPDGKTVYRYNARGLKEETSYDDSGRLVEKIRYRMDKKGNTLSYQVLDEKITWNFIYKAGELQSGKRYFKGELTEYFVFTSKKHKKQIIQSLFTNENKQIGSVKYSYKKGRITQRIKKDSAGLRKAEHHYTEDGLLKEILLYTTDGKGDYQLDKKRIFFYNEEK